MRNPLQPIRKGDLVKLNHIPDQTFIVFTTSVPYPPAVAVMNVDDHDICFCLHTNRAKTRSKKGWKIIGHDISLIPGGSYGLRNKAIGNSGDVNGKVYAAKRSAREKVE